MSKALAWIRKSKGSDDDIGLEEQRQKVPALAEDVAEDVDMLDLGVQTGFSTLSRDGDIMLDDREEVQAALERVRNGEYDHLVAYDDDRICRDGYFEVIKYAATDGDAEFVYVADVPEDELTHDIRRRVERDTKEDEIEKARDAIEARKERGYDHGRPKYGMQYDAEGKYQVPGEDFDTVLEILRMESSGATYDEIADETGVAKSTAKNVVDRREWYIDREEMAETRPT